MAWHGMTNSNDNQIIQINIFKQKSQQQHHHHHRTNVIVLMWLETEREGSRRMSEQASERVSELG